MKYSTKTILTLFLVLCIIQSYPPVLAQGESWLEGWDYRKKVSILGSSGAGTDYQVEIDVDYISGMESDFADLRFTEADGETLLDHWIQEYTASTRAVVWVQVTANLDTDQIIWMYHGNSTVGDASNGDGVFEFFDDFNDASFNLTKWSEMSDYGSEYSEAGGVLDIDPIADRVQIASDTTFDDGGYAVHSFVTFTKMRCTGFVETDLDTTFRFEELALFEKQDAITNIETENEDSRTASVITLDSNTWQVQKVNWYNSSLVDFYVNDTLKGTHSTNIPDGTPALRVGFYVYHIDTDPEMQVDWVFVRHLIYTEPIAFIGEWNALPPVEFIFPVGWTTEQQFGYDMFFIALGLVMIPFSTLYLVKGGRKEMNRDKLFYGLIILIVGLGLVIGGVMP